ncbi:MAG: HNH endonuclease [Myxococcota bacterium]
MSHGKCFYCEYKPDDGGEVDHHIEVADDPSLAFSWTNLYLSCHQCNQAKKKADVSIQECVDPCASDSKPDRELTFDDETIRPRDNSARGRATIRKYGLDSSLLNLRRSRALRELEKARARIQDRRIADQGRPLTDDEREILLSFVQPERPFSAMLKVALRGLIS